MSLIGDLCDDRKWDLFLENKIAGNTCSDREKEDFRRFVKNRMYRNITKKIQAGEYRFSIPRKKSISKAGTDKRRIVYSFTRKENMVLKMMAYLLHRYDRIFADNLYSYRKDIGVKQAIRRITGVDGLERKYCYKADIHDYFNSVKLEKLLPILEDTVDRQTYDVISGILTNPHVLSEGRILREDSKGIMAGIPISAFLADLYLMDMDFHFQDEGVFYARYADDILILADSEEELEEYREYVCNHLASKGLSMNPKKEHIYSPGETIEFLGFGIDGGKVDLADITVKKIKAKIRRASRSISRWGDRTGASPKARMTVMIQKFDRIFFGVESGELSWKKWYFPMINSIEGLETVDRYLQERIRWVGTGHNRKKNYEDVPYELMSALGYVPLVHEYYLYRKELKGMDNGDGSREDV